MNRLHQMRHGFTSHAHLAAFLGVPVATVHDWLSGRREPCAAAARLLDVLARLEGTDLYAAMVAAAMPPPRAPRKRRRRTSASTVYSTPSHGAPEPAWRPQPVLPEWGDDFWYVRTVTREAATDGYWPQVEDGPEALNGMSEAREAEYWASLKRYEERTGRVKP